MADVLLRLFKGDRITNPSEASKVVGPKVLGMEASDRKTKDISRILFKEMSDDMWARIHGFFLPKSRSSDQDTLDWLFAEVLFDVCANPKQQKLMGAKDQPLPTIKNLVDNSPEPLLRRFARKDVAAMYLFIFYLVLATKHQDEAKSAAELFSQLGYQGIWKELDDGKSSEVKNRSTKNEKILEFAKKVSNKHFNPDAAGGTGSKGGARKHYRFFAKGKMYDNDYDSDEADSNPLRDLPSPKRRQSPSRAPRFGSGSDPESSDDDDF